MVQGIELGENTTKALQSKFTSSFTEAIQTLSLLLPIAQSLGLEWARGAYLYRMIDVMNGAPVFVGVNNPSIKEYLEYVLTRPAYFFRPSFNPTGPEGDQCTFTVTPGGKVIMKMDKKGFKVEVEVMKRSYIILRTISKSGTAFLQFTIYVTGSVNLSHREAPYTERTLETLSWAANKVLGESVTKEILNAAKHKGLLVSKERR